MSIGGQSSRFHIPVKLRSEPNYHVSHTILFSSIADLLIMDVGINKVSDGIRFQQLQSWSRVQLFQSRKNIRRFRRLNKYHGFQLEHATFYNSVTPQQTRRTIVYRQVTHKISCLATSSSLVSNWF